MSTSVSRTTSKRKGSRRTVTILCSVMTILFVGGVTYIQGSVSGTEFAPSHFQTRKFSFHEIPFIHIQLTAVKRSIVSDKAARAIRTSGYITTPRGKPPTTWHLVSLTRGPSTTPAIASLLTEALQIEGNGGTFWQNWTTKHPKSAAVLWPYVQRLADRELYVLVPELLQIARTQAADDGQKLRSSIDAWLVGEYAALIDDMRSADRAELADSLLTEARKDYPNASELKELAKSVGADEDAPANP